MLNLNFDAVKKAAEGNWDVILPALQPCLTEAVQNTGKHVDCPIHGGKLKFRFFEHMSEKGNCICSKCDSFDGISLLRELGGKSYPEVMHDIADHLGIKCSSTKKDAKSINTLPAEPKKPAQAPDQDKQAYIDKLGNESKSYTSDLGDYIASRGLKSSEADIPQSIRVHDGLNCEMEDGDYHYVPVMLGQITDCDNTKTVGYQRTYIAPQGLKPATRKKMTSPAIKGATSGCSVKLSLDIKDTIAVVEGNETGLAVQQTTGIPTWCGISANGMRDINLPDSVKVIHIFADLDKSKTGERVSTELANKLAAKGKTVFIHMPDFTIPEGSKGMDWLDVLNKFGENPFNRTLKTVPKWESKKPARLPVGYDMDDKGIYLIKSSGEETQKELIASPPIHVTGSTCDETGSNHGRLVEWTDSAGHQHKQAIPITMLHNDNEMVGLLVDKGVNIHQLTPKANKHIATFIQESKTKRHLTCTSKTGWHGDNYVFPDAVIGNKSAEILYQGSQATKYSVNGSIEEWQQGIGKYCVNNNFLLFSVSCAFAAPLLHLVDGMESGGFNLRGPSSTGKSTSLHVACSVWGGKDYMLTWRTTSNGLEGVAESHNDAFLGLDELGQIDPMHAGDTAYMLANGQGKQRSDKTGNSRKTKEWRTLFLSTGEISLTDHMLEAGRKAKAGQETRLADIPIDTDSGYGIFDVLHGFTDGAKLSDILKHNASLYYGSPIRLFLQAITQYIADNGEEAFKHLINTYMEEFCKSLPGNLSGQVHRVAKRFAVTSTAGELATQFGVTDWPKGEALKGTLACFHKWFEERGSDKNAEHTKAINQIRSFIETHEMSRFSELGDQHNRVNNLAGYKRMTACGYEYFIPVSSWKEQICKGIDAKQAAKAMLSDGFLMPDGNGNPTRSQRLNKRTSKVYHVKAEFMNDNPAIQDEEGLNQLNELYLVDQPPTPDIKLAELLGTKQSKIQSSI